MAVTQQASKLRANEMYNGGASGVRTTYMKVEFAGAFNQVQHLIGSAIKTGTPGTYKVQFAVTDAIAVDTVANAYLPVRAGVTYNDKSANGWKDATFGGAASKQIGLVASTGSIIHMSTDVMNLSSIPRADGKAGGILLIKVTQTDSAGTYTVGNGSSSAWDAARGKPWFTEWYSKSVAFDAIADLTRIPTGGPFNEDYAFPGFPVVTNTASDLPTDLLMFTGDSRKSAAYMTNLFANQSRMAAMSLCTPGHPISTVNASGSGKSQNEYLAIAMDMLTAGVRPTVIALPGYSQNGFSNSANFITANANFMAAVRAIPGLENVKFVLDTDYTLGTYGGSTPNGEGYKAAEHARSLANGTTVFCFDSDPIITDYTTTPGTPKIKAPYLVGGDSIHAGPAGISAMAYGTGQYPSLTSVYATAFGISNVAVVPGAPTVGTATAGNGSASVTGTAPAATNGGVITVYRATAMPGNITATSATLPVTVTGLTPGTAYTLTLAAANGAGYGPESLASNSVTPTDVPASDTTAPVMTGSITVSAITSSGFTLACDAATDAVGVAGYEYSIDGGTNYTTIANAARTVTVTGRAASTSHPIRMRAFDAAGNRATPLSATATTTAAADTTPPVMVGTLTIASITDNGATASWQAATDGAGVAGYEYSLNGGAYSNFGTGRSLPIMGLPAGTQATISVRAYDSAGNKATPISATFTTLSATPTGPMQFTPSDARTLTATVSSTQPFAAPATGGFWNVLTNPKKPIGVKDPDATIDITLDWAAVFADIKDNILANSGAVVLSPPAQGVPPLVDAGSTVVGTKQTVFLSGGLEAGDYPVTFRVSSASTPPRKFDRTVVIKIESQ